jgi:hypothetical protein
MKFNILTASALALSAGFAPAAAAQTSSPADTCILDYLDDVRDALRNIQSPPSLTTTVIYRGEELGALLKFCEDKSNAKAVLFGKTHEISITYSP